MDSTKQLEKPVFQSEAPDDFFSLLNKEVRSNILTNKKIQNKLRIKALLLLFCYFLSYSFILIFGNQTYLLFISYIVTGLLMIMVFLNGFHDAAHGSLFQNKKYNSLFSYVLELFGTNNFIWKKRHLMLHHPYPNMQHWDIDIKQSNILHLFSDSPKFNYHKYQHIYMWFLYPFYTLNWIFIRDFKDFFGTKDNYLKRVVKIPKIEYYKLFAAKIFNLSIMLVLPMLVLNQPWYIVLAAFFSMHIVASCYGVIALLSTHVDEHAHFPLPPEDGKIKSSWARYQIMETKDFSPNSKLASWLFGGFNHHVAHHLFPHVAHTYYPYITKLIRRYSDEYNLNYTSYPIHKAIFSHYKLLKKSGMEDSLFHTREL